MITKQKYSQIEYVEDALLDDVAVNKPEILENNTIRTIHNNMARLEVRLETKCV